MTQYSTRIALLLVVAALFAACSKRDDGPESVSSQAAATTVVDSVQGGKPTAPVDISFAISGKPEGGKSSEVELTVVATAPSDRIDLAIQATPGLELTGNAVAASFFNASEGASFVHRVKIVPRADGVYFLTAIATTHLSGGAQSRTAGMRVVVGDVAIADKPAIAPTVDSSGQSVTSQPAVETTR